MVRTWTLDLDVGLQFGYKEYWQAAPHANFS
jgi:hypothetical protein